MYENGTIIESPFGFSVVRVAVDPNHDVWLATDHYRGSYQDAEVDSWRGIPPEGEDFPVGTGINLDDDWAVKRDDGSWHWVREGRRAYLRDSDMRRFIRNGDAKIRD